MDPAGLDPATIAVAAGRGDPAPGAPLNVPPVLASTYRAGRPVSYGRVENPTWTALEEALGALEGGTARIFSSGMAAIAAVLDGVPDGAHVVAPAGAYTGTRALVHELAERGRIRLTEVDVVDTPAVLAALHETHLLWLESPTNPLIGVADLPGLIAAAHDRGAVVVVDSTFATPLRQQPLALGADVVVHSATKFISGHSDLILGVAVARDPQRVEALHGQRTLHGAAPGPMEAWLALRGLRTLPVRLDRAESNAGFLARRLDEHGLVSRVRYPGLPGDPGHERARAQMSGFGAVLSFEVGGRPDVAEAVCAAVRLIGHTTSLGGVETTMERRARHPGEGAPPDLIRVSVGIEHHEDIWADLAQALEAAAGSAGPA